MTTGPTSNFHIKLVSDGDTTTANKKKSSTDCDFAQMASIEARDTRNSFRSLGRSYAQAFQYTKKRRTEQNPILSVWTLSPQAEYILHQQTEFDFFSFFEFCTIATSQNRACCFNAYTDTYQLPSSVSNKLSKVQTDANATRYKHGCNDPFYVPTHPFGALSTDDITAYISPWRHHLNSELWHLSPLHLTLARAFWNPEAQNLHSFPFHETLSYWNARFRGTVPVFSEEIDEESIEKRGSIFPSPESLDKNMTCLFPGSRCHVRRPPHLKILGVTENKILTIEQLLPISSLSHKAVNILSVAQSRQTAGNHNPETRKPRKEMVVLTPAIQKLMQNILLWSAASQGTSQGTKRYYSTKFSSSTTIIFQHVGTVLQIKDDWFKEVPRQDNSILSASVWIHLLSKLSEDSTPKLPHNALMLYLHRHDCNSHSLTVAQAFFYVSNIGLFW
ncbi:hypothetical protein C8Q75DRAFT_728755 [Abortiporus biennis]|nr:hypothetical protein C8Q75DRAFT_728755 [Abortiporus biennis]